jgi:two-component sensor histidine kinase
MYRASSQGKLRLAFETVDLASTIDQAVRACRPAMDTRQQQLRVRLPLQALPLRGDPVRLGQVVSNLLDNASKYTPDGGEIALTAVVVDGAIVITVSDSGIGIATEALPRVFEPFVQDARAIGFNGAGLGIGLTVVRELVEGHGGSVVARSAGIGLGSQFVVTLPLAVAGANARAARNPRACSLQAYQLSLAAPVAPAGQFRRRRRGARQAGLRRQGPVRELPHLRTRCCTRPVTRWSNPKRPATRRVPPPRCTARPRSKAFGSTRRTSTTAATLEDVGTAYNNKRALGLTAQESRDLAHYLKIAVSDSYLLGRLFQAGGIGRVNRLAD